MSTAKTKKKIRRRQKGPLQRRNARRDVTSNSATRRRRTADDSGTSGRRTASPSLSTGTSDRRSTTPATLTRRQGTRNLLPGRTEARRARADARADGTSYTPPQVRKPPALKRQKAQRDLRATQAKQASPTGKSKRDWATGRTLFPVESGGKTQYFPIASEATPHERRHGLFVTDSSVQKDTVNQLLDPAQVDRASVRDFNTGRTLFATENADGKREYLPKASEATARELSQGKYVPDAQVEVPPQGNEVLDQRPLYEFNGQRNLFPTKAADGTVEYLPKQSDANAFELSQGRYVDDAAISAQAPLGATNAMSNRSPRYDIGKGRQVYAVETVDDAGKRQTRYLPRESDATGFEQARGLFIPDDTVDRHERKRLRTALRDDSAQLAQRRSQRAATLPAGVPNRDRDTSPDPVTQATDGTPLWDGFTPPEVSEAKQRETLTNLRPRYDLGKGRRVYPTETAQGKIEYLPLLEDASNRERILGLYATFVPPEPLEDFLAATTQQNQIVRQDFATDRGDVKAYAQADIADAFEQAPTLVLRSAQLVSNKARQTPELHQQFKGE
ncbi:MAG: hypothetical protein AAGE59_07745 [Cyanobacteria bacterium P01_F01_bin.86]